MCPQSHRDFDSSPDKSLVRQGWDRPILDAFALRLGHPLAYFGLPGPALHDVLEWRSVLGQITGVERLRRSGEARVEDLERHRRLLRNVMENDLENFQLLRGEIEDVIINGLDVDREAPKLHTGGSAAAMRFRYDVINLDFLGGVGYRAVQGSGNRESKRIEALKKLFERQHGHEFVLLLTVNVRDGIGDELRSYLTNTTERVDAGLGPILTWYATRGLAGKKYILKAVVPLFIQRVAEDHMFAVHAYPPVAYGGTGAATMVHFVFSLTPQTGDLQAFSPQSVRDLLNLPLVTTEQGVLRICPTQHPGYDFAVCGNSLTFLPSAVQNRMVDGIQSLAQRDELEHTVSD